MVGLKTEVFQTEWTGSSSEPSPVYDAPPPIFHPIPSHFISPHLTLRFITFHYSGKYHATTNLQLVESEFVCTSVHRKVLLCIMIWNLANLLKTIAAKVRHPTLPLHCARYTADTPNVRSALFTGKQIVLWLCSYTQPVTCKHGGRAFAFDRVLILGSEKPSRIGELKCNMNGQLS